MEGYKVPPDIIGAMLLSEDTCNKVARYTQGIAEAIKKVMDRRDTRVDEDTCITAPREDKPEVMY